MPMPTRGWTSIPVRCRWRSLVKVSATPCVLAKTDMKKSLILGCAYGAEALVLNLYTGGTKVEYEQMYVGNIRYSEEAYD